MAYWNGPFGYSAGIEVCCELESAEGQWRGGGMLPCLLYYTGDSSTCMVELGREELQAHDRQKTEKTGVVEPSHYYKPSVIRSHLRSKIHKYTPIFSVEEIETAFHSRIKTYPVKNVNAYKDPKHFLNYVKETVTGLISKHSKSFKVNMKFFTAYKRGIGGNIEYVEISFKTKNEIILKSTCLEEYYTNILMLISQKKIKNKQAVINGKNDVQKCFLWSVLSALHQVKKDPLRVNKYEAYEREFDDALKGLEFPMKLDSIPTLEKRSGISINVYANEEENGGKQYIISPLKITNNKMDKHINQLYIKEEKNDHYYWVKSLSRLVTSQITKNSHEIFICDRCLQHFFSVNKLKDHEQEYRDHYGVRGELPFKGKNDILRFKN
ncbi:hypothetical protein PR048_019946 [Dryococelus australis]|uniref:C2H2-type domain-containing protein n=1 Tax=Dryococelus australis TaxID=614101 RepID=A0ABQ9H596_9NEOP|nr:hypothetical protein PR048_019946 [Dryococelus australis]